MRVLLTSSSTSPSQKAALLRAAWALLYAHYEGFCKNALTAFFAEISGCQVVCAQLPTPTRVLALRSTLKRLRHMPDEDMLLELEEFPTLRLAQVPTFPEPDTRSNLLPDVLIGLIRSADLSPAKVEEHRAKLTVLVKRRNVIAHGEKSFIAEYGYYKSFEDAVYDVVYDLVYQVEARLRGAPYSAAS